MNVSHKLLIILTLLIGFNFPQNRIPPDQPQDLRGRGFWDPLGMNPGIEWVWKHPFCQGEFQENPEHLFEMQVLYNNQIYNFTTSQCYLSITGINSGSLVEMARVTAVNAEGETSLPSDTWVPVYAPPSCDHDPPADFAVEFHGDEFLLTWTYGDYSSPLGDSVENPYIIDDLPYFFEGTTEGFNHNTDAECPYFDSFAPDVVFQWQAAPGNYALDICDSDYDNKLYVIHQEEIFGCSDDFCYSPQDEPYRAALDLDIGVAGLYYIVVDGYDDQSGNFSFVLESNDGRISAPSHGDESNSLIYDRPNRDQCVISHFNIYRIQFQENEWGPYELLDLLGSTTQLGYSIPAQDGCYQVTVDDHWGGVFESDPSEIICVEDYGCDCLIGDLNCDGELSILDVVQLVDIILFPEHIQDCDDYHGDVDEDDELDVVDIVFLVGLIFD